MSWSNRQLHPPGGGEYAMGIPWICQEDSRIHGHPSTTRTVTHRHGKIFTAPYPGKMQLADGLSI
ncbi:hypothetical protein TWF281_006099 [Arthrobotrys megalospora]